MEMACNGIPTTAKPLPAIAPAPPNMVTASPPPMAHSCRSCAARKVKCDKGAPSCSACRKAKLDCVYQPLAPRRRKRKLSGGLSPSDKLARYERILQQLGVLEPDEAATPSSASTTTTKEPPPEDSPLPLRFIPWGHSQMTKVGKILATRDKSRYIDSDFWGDLGDDEEDGHPVSDDDEEQEEDMSYIHRQNGFADPLTGAFMGCPEQRLTLCHPTHVEAMAMWQVHSQNVEPLCKILHIPSVATLVETVSRQVETATKPDECLLFAIYHFAVFSMTDDECIEKLRQPRAVLRQRYHFAARQALTNASFLRTTDMTVLQALVLFLLACRESYDPHTYWILTGVAVRIAQRMGIHRDGEKLGLPPFQVQMRRRLFYQLMPLDATVSQISGVGIMMPPDTWDTQPALNVNDDQIWPSMTEPPQEQKGATDMIFCLSRFCIGKSIAGAVKNGAVMLSREYRSYSEADRVIDEAEREVEDKYIRYCDVINPLHFLAVGLARSGITAMRLRTRLPSARTSEATDERRREIMQFAQRILDTDSAAHDHASVVKRFRWYVSAFFLWGMWDSLVFVLTTLATRSGMLSPDEVRSAWERMERVYQNHQELLHTKRALHVALQRLTLRAWDASHPNASQGEIEPAFVKTLRSMRRHGKRVATEGAAPSLQDGTHGEAKLGGVVDGDIPFETAIPDFDIDPIDYDWTFWEPLIESDALNRTEEAFGDGGL